MNILNRSCNVLGVRVSWLRHSTTMLMLCTKIITRAMLCCFRVDRLGMIECFPVMLWFARNARYTCFASEFHNSDGYMEWLHIVWRTCDEQSTDSLILIRVSHTLIYRTLEHKNNGNMEWETEADTKTGTDMDGDVPADKGLEIDANHNLSPGEIIPRRQQPPSAFIFSET